MSNLSDLLEQEIRAGALTEPFTVEDVRELIQTNDGLLGGRPPPQRWDTNLANFSVGPGDREGESVKRGARALFRKNEQRATYSLLGEDDEEDEESAETTLSQDTDGDAIAGAFVEYLRNKPFRTLATTYSAESSAMNQVWGTSVVVGWWSRLQSYGWRRANWISTQTRLAGFEIRLQAAEAQFNPDGSTPGLEETVGLIYDDIKAWGNPKGRARDGSQVLSLLRPLWSNMPISEVDSTLTKLYALARPNDYVIYDSRVAASITSIAEDIYRWKSGVGDTVDSCFRRVFPHIGHFNSAASYGTRPRGLRFRYWPNAYTVTAAQQNANELCIAIRDCLNRCSEPREDDNLWTLREVEAVLFMEGY